MDNNYTYEYLKKQTEDHLAHFIYQFSEKVINNEASLFIGAGVSRNSGYPGWADLLSECADDLNINSNTIDLYSLAQYYANKHSDAELRRIISQKINTLPKSNNLLNNLLEIDFNNIWTTNYDKLIEKGLEEKEKPYNVIFSDKNLSSIDKHDKVNVYKMNGDISDPVNMVLTKNDYEHYLKKTSTFFDIFKKRISFKYFSIYRLQFF